MDFDNGFSPLGSTSRIIDLRYQAPRAKVPKFFDDIPKTVICQNLSELVESQQNPQPVEYVPESAIQEQLSAKNKEAAEVAV